MKFPTLYSRTSTGAIQQWTIEVVGDCYRMITGQVGSPNLVYSDWTKCEGKNIGRANETSGQEQAIKEAEAKIKKKKKEDYKEDIDDIDNLTYIEPMLAKHFLDRLKYVTYPCIVDRKFNGGRILAIKKGLFTRKGEEYVSIPHIYEALEEKFRENPNLFVDGEGYNHDYRYKLNEIMKLIRKTVHVTQEDLDKSRDKVRYYVYDFYGADGVTKATNQFERREKLQEFFADIPFIVPVVGKIARNEAEVWDIYNEYVNDGYEGAMVRLNGPYEHKRSSLLLKVKPEMDDEGIILAIEEGDGNWSGAATIATIKWKDKTFNVTFKGSYEDRAKILEDKKNWIGKEVTFLYNDLNGKGIPNFARIDIYNCFKR